ncbi:MAG: SAM-dependent methyltransferase [Candidatus Marinimicrobia bacterium]|nr:SAM-dependent methyltransferase [Candidatus Neomarinimicrobiota bacterium]|tara:strand:+ start:72845 stop:73831 length:987 start_codon:yes stop_codon:yes gene_type:complete
MKESDIRSQKMMSEYLRLASIDAEKFFNRKERTEIPCPACGSTSGSFEFKKYEFDYVSCGICASLYQSPRPHLDTFKEFYNNSPSSNFWAKNFFPSVAESRREIIFKPRVDQLAKFCNDKHFHPGTVMDIGAGYGIFLEEWKKRFPKTRCIAVEPAKNMAAICRNKDLEVVEAFAEDVESHVRISDLVVCFEVFEHVHNPIEFVKTLCQFTSNGGYLMISTLGVDGFDIQVLWQNSNSVSPPHHINFFSIKGFKSLFKRIGLEDITILTPGKLDVDIVRNAYRKDPKVLKDQRYLKELLADKSKSEAFQNFLSENLMSSHTWVIAKKS